MQLMFLGSGSAFCITPDNFQSNILLTSTSGRRLLVDCGTDIRFSLAAQGMGYRDVDDIYISHLHADHVGGMEFMGFSSMFDTECAQPGLYISESIKDELWTNCLAGGMSATDDKSLSLSDYFSVHAISGEGKFVWEGVEFNLVAVDHVHGKEKPMNSFGLFFTVGKKSVYLTTDTKFSPQKLGRYMQDADLILHDCETSPYASGVHARFEDLASLPEAIRNKIWLYHYDDGALPDPLESGFCGFVRRGQVFDLPE
jgi:ribonuclease BN (tRNA processing enzyme)